MAQVRQPIQVYLSSAERTQLERLASRLGVSRSEVLRRGLGALGEAERPGDAALADLVRRGWLHPPLHPPAPLPTRKPVYKTLTEMLADLDETRADR
jgi:hypothetical protein